METVQKAAGCLVEYLWNTCWYWPRIWTKPQQPSTEGVGFGVVEPGVGPVSKHNKLPSANMSSMRQAGNGTVFGLRLTQTEHNIWNHGRERTRSSSPAPAVGGKVELPLQLLCLGEAPAWCTSSPWSPKSHRRGWWQQCGTAPLTSLLHQGAQWGRH